MCGLTSEDARASASTPHVLKAPCELDVCAAFDFLAGGWRAKFRMVIVQETLPDDGPFQRLRRLPAQTAIELVVGRDRLVRDPTDMTKSEIELQTGPQVQGLTQEPKMIGIVRFRAAEGLVGAARFGTDVKPQFRVTRTQTPPITGAILCRQLCAVRGAGLSVREHDGKGRRAIDLLGAAQVVVVVVEGRHRKRQPIMGPAAITELVSQHFFRNK